MQRIIKTTDRLSMGFRVNSPNIQALNQLRESQAERPSTRDLNPLYQFRTGSSQLLTQKAALRIQELNPGVARLSQDLSYLLTMRDPSNRIQAGGGGLAQGLTPAPPEDLEELQAIQAELSADFQERSFRTAGLGDRTIDVTQSPPREVDFLFPNTETQSYDFTESIDGELSISQEDALYLRDTIQRAAEDFLLVNPTASLDDLEIELDSLFSSGISDLFKLSVQNRGDATSEIKLTQIDLQSLTLNEREVVEEALANASTNFEPASELRFSLEGDDIDKVLNELDHLGGLLAKPALNQLRKNLSRPSSLFDSLQAYKESLQSVPLGSKDQRKVEELISYLERAGSHLLTKFENRPIADDMIHRFTSGRFRKAFSPNEIANVAALTENSDWLDD